MGVVRITDANMGGGGGLTDPTISVPDNYQDPNANSPYIPGYSAGNAAYPTINTYASNITPLPSGGGNGDALSTGIGGGAPNQIGGGSQPAPQAAPVMSPDQWLAGDSTFQGQQNDYNQQLKSFLDRLNQQKSDYTQDFNTAQNAFNQNRDRNLLSLGEDWTSRGMANSGLFNQARDLANRDYQNQQQGMDTANSRALANFTQQGTDRTNEINQAIENARSQSLARMAANQAF